MALVIFSKLYRRIIIRRFGNLQNALIWLGAVILTIYLLDNYVFTRQQMQSIVGGGPANEPPEKRAEPVTTPTTVKQPAAPVVQPPKPPVPAADKKGDGPSGNRLPCLEKCPAGQISYYLKSGKDRDISPILCIDGNYVMSDTKKIAKRGLNVVVINNATLAVEDTKSFDTYESDALLIRYLKLSVQEGHYILVATLDEASFHLTDEGRETLHRYGSSLISKLGFRDNFVMIGQRGLKQGSAIEKNIARKEGNEFGETAELSGCMNFRLGEVVPVVISEEERILLSGGPKVGRDKADCGVKTPCDAKSFSVQMFTGSQNKYMAKVCIGGKYVFGEGLNDAGRGLNIAVVNSETKEVIRVGHFDTFGTDSSNLEIFMEMLNPGDIVIVVSYDESSKNFDLASQKLFQMIGSSFANKITFRDAWVFVGQHGLKGYSPIEELSPALGGWPNPIDKILCVPTTLTGLSSPLPDPPRPSPPRKKKKVPTATLR